MDIRPNSYNYLLNYKDGYQKYFRIEKKIFSKKTFIFSKNQKSKNFKFY